MPLNSQKITIQDIAQLANVSVATVSRTLSNPEKVSDITRQQVLATIEATGYSVNETARNLRKRQTDTIVVMTPNIGNPYFSRLVEGIEEVFAHNQISVLIADTQKASMNSSHARNYFSRNRVDGIIILDGLIAKAIIEDAKGSPPILFAGERHAELNLPYIGISDELGIELAVKHLYSLGHTRIGHIAGPLTHTPGQRRYTSFLKTLSQLNLPTQEAWIHEGLFQLSTGQQAAYAWANLASDQRPTAICSAGDEIAFGFIATLHQLGFRVPHDVSVVGYDDLHLAACYIPALTTIHQPCRTLGRSAAKQLLNLIKKHPFTPLPLLDPTLIIRDSTAPYNR
ncbi:LacI family DNA-binding transcriptional regulator [Thiofilum flexile]|uniref:LacI family DNA-binding transcriptional regulator n=1 Tax=Thiofilum flexile TaxID=125627 RepID=UPI0003632CBD|nr:LacI family DNA-binding transcriptional regulator [Thiofilum flexile]